MCALAVFPGKKNVQTTSSSVNPTAHHSESSHSEYFKLKQAEAVITKQQIERFVIPSSDEFNTDASYDENTFEDEGCSDTSEDVDEKSPWLGGKQQYSSVSLQTLLGQEAIPEEPTKRAKIEELQTKLDAIFVKEEEYQGERYLFDVTVQEDILRLLVRDRRFTNVANRWIRSEYFLRAEHRWLCEFVLQFTNRYKHVPTKGQILSEMTVKKSQGWKIKTEDLSKINGLIDLVYDEKVVLREYTLEAIRDFAETQEWQMACLALPQYLRKGDLKSIRRLAKHVLNMPQGIEDDEGYWYFGASQQRVFERSDDSLYDYIIPTGIKELDDLLPMGGIWPGEIGLCFGATNRGKSIFLLNCAKRAIWMRKRVVVYSFEMSDKKIANRLDASFTGLQMKELQEEREALLNGLGDLQTKFGEDALLIKRYPSRGATIADIERHLEGLRERKNWWPHLIILDYAGIVKPSRSFGDKTHKEDESVMAEFRGLCVKLTDMGYPTSGWTANQLNRSGAGKIVADERDAKNSYDQASEPDYILTLNQEDWERTQNLMRIFLSKNREGEVSITLGPYNTDFSRMQFVVPLNGKKVEVRRPTESPPSSGSSGLGFTSKKKYSKPSIK